MKLHLQLPLSHSAYQWLKKQADKVGASGHIGTHMDCYTTLPTEPTTIVGCVVINHSELKSQDFTKIDLNKKALIIYTGNIEQNGYGPPQYSNLDSTIDKDILVNILQANPKFILIDSHGIAPHGKEHISNDILCERSNCFVIENVNLKRDTLTSIKNIEIAIDINNKSTGKPCRISCLT